MRTPHNEPVSSDIVAPVSAPETGSDGTRPPKPRRKAVPERRCILTGAVAARDGLLRLALSPDGVVLPDPLAKAPGRGAWIGVTRAELEMAMANGKLRGGLARAHKGASLTIPADLPTLIDQALERIALNRLGIEMRGGMILMGSDKIAEKARSGRISLLMHAVDAGEDGTKKLDQAWRVGRDAEGSGARGIVLPLDRAALSMALGRDNVVHLAVADRAAAARISQAVSRLTDYRGADGASSKNTRDDANTRAHPDELNA